MRGPSSGSSARRPQGSPVRVLLIDDDEDSFLLTRRLLSGGKALADVDWASTFEEGLKGIRLGQYLAGISFMAKLLQNKLADKRLPEAADAAQITELVNQTVAQTRDLARGLCPLELETNGLPAALEELAASAEKLFNVSCRLRCDAAEVIPDKATGIHLYRIAQEAINNAVKHGKAKAIKNLSQLDAV